MAWFGDGVKSTRTSPFSTIYVAEHPKVTRFDLPPGGAVFTKILCYNLSTNALILWPRLCEGIVGALIQFHFSDGGECGQHDPVHHYHPGLLPRHHHHIEHLQEIKTKHAHLHYEKKITFNAAWALTYYNKLYMFYIHDLDNLASSGTT